MPGVREQGEGPRALGTDGFGDGVGTGQSKRQPESSAALRTRMLPAVSGRIAVSMAVMMRVAVVMRVAVTHFCTVGRDGRPCQAGRDARGGVPSPTGQLTPVPPSPQ